MKMKKKSLAFPGLLSVLLIAGLTLAACPAGGGGGGGGGDTLVTDLSLNSKVTAPVRGAAPDTTAINEAQYTGTINWQTGDGAAHTGVFAPSTVYKAVVTLTAKSGYTFAGLGAGSFTYIGAASVANAANSGTVTITFPATAAPGQDTAVSEFSLDSKVTAPVRDAQPVTGPIDAAQYTGTIAWQTEIGAAHSGAFAPSTVYKAVVTLSAKTGYTFTGVAANSFTYSGAAQVTNAANSGTVTIVFPATAAPGEDTVVNTRSLDGKITAPVRGSYPDTTAINEAQYTGTIAWLTSGGASHTGAFAPSTVYRAVVYLAAKPGYTFDGVGADSFTYSGAAQVANAANSGTLTITFPATGAGESAPAVVSAFSLDGKVTAPVRGATPNTTAINEAQYTGTIAWRTFIGTAHTGAFAAATVYKAVVTLTAKPGYTFTGMAENSFTYTGAAVTNTANIGIVTIVFPATAGESEPAVVSAFSLDGKVTAPVRGAAPNTTGINEAQYTGTITWRTFIGMTHTGAFAASAVYRAVVTLTAKSGYTFDGVGANSFTYSGAVQVTNTANSGTVTIVFPATGAGESESAVVSAFFLDGKVTAPVWGAYPDTTAINEAQYMGTIVWQTSGGAAHSGAFAASTVYKAVVTLSAKSGWTFTGVGANSFAYTGAAQVTNAANSGTVTITFPATGTSSAWTFIDVSFTGPGGSNDISVDGGFKLSKSDSSYSSITISVGDAGSYDAFRWLVDGEALAGETGGSVTLNASAYNAGAYWLTVIAEKGGVPYSREFSFAVVN